MRKIKKMNDEKLKKLKSQLYSKQSNNYNIDEYERIKTKKINFDNSIILKHNSNSNRNNSIIKRKFFINNNSYKNSEKENNSINFDINNNNIQIYKIKNNFRENLKKIKLNKSNSCISIFKENRIKNLNNILDLCKGEIKHGKVVGKKFEKYNDKISDDIKEIIQKESKENKNIKDQQLIEKEMKENNDKYKLKEIEKFNEMKKKIDIKISEVFAYFNRKEFSKQIKDKDTNKAFELYLKDINKINQKIEGKKKIEKESIHKIKFLLEQANKGKKILENKINEYNEKHEILNQINNNNLEINLNNEEQNSEESNEFNIFYPPSDIKTKPKKRILPKLLLKAKNYE